ncbi:alpha/beta hydrolase [Corynebacterium lubricantis]|uniref:alpha/beta hydrolase n=1 Tax=Corynebacterium lubricantis TaxID=541095 RepID=UPI0003785E80|nr:alpha/beta hydrolase [Corynebacterium lubricantis]
MNRRSSLKVALATLLSASLLASCGTNSGTNTQATQAESTTVSSSSKPALTQPPATNPADATVQRLNYPVSGGDPNQNWADLYLPPGQHDAATLPLLVFIHGGAWMNTSGAEGADRIARDLTARGIAVYNVEYRRVHSGGGWPTTFTDVAAAIDHVPTLSQQYPELNLDASIVAGHSAGAQLAVWGATRNNNTGDLLGGHPQFKPSEIISLSGPLDLSWAANHGDTRIEYAIGGTPEQYPDRFESVDPILNMDPTIPVVAVHGDADDLVPKENSIHYVDALNADNGKGELVLLMNENHTSYLKADSPSYPKVIDLITQTAYRH